MVNCQWLIVGSLPLTINHGQETRFFAKTEFLRIQDLLSEAVSELELWHCLLRLSCL